LKARLVPALRHWIEDNDLAGVRDEAELAKLPEVELAKLPEVERQACRKFWAGVDRRGHPATLKYAARVVSLGSSRLLPLPSQKERGPERE
jgi:hypothetical protein